MAKEKCRTHGVFRVSEVRLQADNFLPGGTGSNQEKVCVSSQCGGNSKNLKTFHAKGI